MKTDDLKELIGKVTPMPWAYRPTQYDDWGTVRAGEWFICQAKDPRHLEDDRLNSCRKNGCDPWEANARLIAMAPDLAAEVLRLRDENEKLRKLDVQYGRVEAAIIMADPNFDGDSDHGNCGDRLVASVFRLRAEVERLTEALVEIRDLPDVDADNRSVIAHAALSGDTRPSRA